MALAASVVSTSSLARQGSSLSLGSAESDDLDKPGDELEEWERAEDMMDVFACAAAAPELKPHESAIVFTNNLGRSNVLG